MTGEIGQAWWEADLKDEKLKAKLRELDALLRQHGQMSEQSLNRGWSQAIDNAGQSVQKLGRNMTSAGDSMTRNLTVPLVGAGVATGKLALDFETTMNQIVGLTDVPREAIAGISDEILAMGRRVGKSPQELAEAFYFVASAGFAADEAMDVLETSARAAASGLGETQDIAKVLGGVINAYGKENITAARAADILVEAVSQGTAEASEFATVLGNVVPGAAALGVSFDQVTAAMAGMTLSGVGVEESATSLIQIFSSLQKPTVQAEAAMEGLGISSAELRKQLREEGLLATLRTLEERFAGNETASAAVFGNIRALRGVTALLGLDSEQLNSVFEKVNDSNGRLALGYEETEGSQRDIARSMADLQAVAIELGEDVLPVVVDVLKELAGGAREFARWWGTLDDDTKRMVVQMAALLAVAGPVLSIIGKLTTGVGGLIRVVAFLGGPKSIAFLRAFGTGFLVALGPIGLVIAAVGALALAWKTDFMGIQSSTEISNGIIAMHFGDIGDKANTLADRFGTSFGDIKSKVRDRMEETGESVEEALAYIERELEGIPITADRSFEAFTTEIHGHLLAAKGIVAEDVGAIPPEIAAILADGAPMVGDGADAMTDEMIQAAIDARAAVVTEMAAMLDGLTGMFETEEDLPAAWKDLIDRLDDPYTEAERKADIFSQTTVGNIRAAIQSGDPGATADAAELVNNMLNQFALLEPGALERGDAVPPALRAGMDAQIGGLIAWIETNVTGEALTALTLEEAEELGLGGIWRYAQGMRRNQAAAVAEARNVAARARVALGIDLYGDGQRAGMTWVGGFGSAAVVGAAWGAGAAIAGSAGMSLRGLSPPRDGPLKNIDKDALRVGLAWAHGLPLAAPEAARGAGMLASAAAAALTLQASGVAFDSGMNALAPSLGGSARSDGAGAGSVTTITRNINLHAIQGYPILENETDTLRTLQQAQWFDEWSV